MSALKIYNSTATTRETFINELTAFLTDSENGCVETSSTSVSPTAITDAYGNKVTIKYSSSSYKSATFKFGDFVPSDNDYNFIITAGMMGSSTVGYTNTIQCIPLCHNVSSSYQNYATTLYSDKNKIYTELALSNTNMTSNTGAEVYSNFRAMSYSDSNTKFVSLGNAGDVITLSTHRFVSVDDPEDTKLMLIVTDRDGYVSLYDDNVPGPFYVDPTYHNGKNIGYTNSINAYKYTVKGYYCDSLYYFDGGYTMPEEGISTIGGIKFLKIGSSNLFLKID